jgi:hypothetical protein
VSGLDSNCRLKSNMGRRLRAGALLVSKPSARRIEVLFRPTVDQQAFVNFNIPVADGLASYSLDLLERGHARGYRVFIPAMS